MKIQERLRKLFFSPASPLPLASLRVGLSLILLFQAGFLVRDLLSLYAPDGFIQGDLRRFVLAPALPFYIDWVNLGERLNLAPDLLIRGTFLVYVTALSFLLIGFHSRVACVLAWLTHFVLKLNMGYTSSYGVDTFAHIFLFYLTLMPMNRAFSLDRRLGRVVGDAAEWQRFWLRVMQLHLFLIYCSTGIEKAIGWQWQTGEVIWRAWMMPQFAVYNMSWLAWVPWVAKGLAWTTLLFEIGYPVFLAIPRTRVFGALGIIGMHLGIAFTMHLWSFSFVMITLTSCAFLIPSEPAGTARYQIPRPFFANWAARLPLLRMNQSVMSKAE